MIVTILGGTGTLGTEVVKELLLNPRINRIRILSRGEHRQVEMARELTSSKLDFFIGDIRDAERVERAVNGAEWVFHFAAMKHVDKAEYDPDEAVKTNIHGTGNVISACKKMGVGRAIFTSTDKAVAPINVYGATKLVAEKLFIQANIGGGTARFSVARYGNVFGSQGSVATIWAKRLKKRESIQITHYDMSRFFISKGDAAKFVVSCLEDSRGAEVFVPKMKATTMKYLFETMVKRLGVSREDYVFEREALKTVGVRPGEKMHEVLISKDEIAMTTELEDRYIIWPSYHLFPAKKRGSPIKQEFTSLNARAINDDELNAMIDEVI